MPEESAGSKKRYVNFDRESGELSVNLPEDLMSYKDELLEDLQMRFGFEALSVANLDRINQYVTEWLERQTKHP